MQASYQNKFQHNDNQDAFSFLMPVKHCFETGSFEDLYKIEQEIIDTGKPDSFWNLMVMYGILQASGRKMRLDYHYVEIYFGMMLAHSI